MLQEKSSDMLQKVQYFTPKTLHQQAENIRQLILPLREKYSFELIIDQSALLVLDMQRFFLDQGSHAWIPSADPIIPQIKQLIKLFQSNDRPIIFTQHHNVHNSANLMNSWWSDILTEESDSYAITSELLETMTNHTATIKKQHYDAFFKTELESVLTALNITQVVITGVMTHLCVETTARSAFTRGFKPFLVIDGTATYNETFHKATVLNLSHGFATAVLSTEILTRPEQVSWREIT